MNPEEELQISGHQMPSGKPVMLTFFDSLGDYPYTVTFYVRESATHEQTLNLIAQICNLSECVLGKYKIGYQQFIVPNYWDTIKTLPQGIMGTQKWIVSYYTYSRSTRSSSIPGRHIETSLRVTSNVMKKPGKEPDLRHIKWQNFLDVFREICVTKEGEEIYEPITASYSMTNWPPKGYKKQKGR